MMFVSNGSQRRSLLALDGLNFCLADVQGGIGPYLSVYLLASRNWNASSIGIAMSAMTIATLIAQTPGGSLIDRTRRKRGLMAASAGLIGVACIAMTLTGSVIAVVSAQVLVGVAAAVLGPGVAAISLGMVGHERLSTRLGRNGAFNHAGNVISAALAGLLSFFVTRALIFYLVAFFAVLSIVSILAIAPGSIDNDLARGGKSDTSAAVTPARVLDVLHDRRLLFFIASIVLFHFANAAMLPLLGQYLAKGHAHGAALFMSACIIVAQLVMLPVAALCGIYADRWGRKPLFLIAFIVLPIRGVLYAFSTNPVYLISIQVLDGVASGIFGVLAAVIVADLTRGTGRYNVTQGLVATAVGLGAFCSNLLSGFVVVALGYPTTFVSLAAIAVIALIVFATRVPETRNAPPLRGSMSEASTNSDPTGTASGRLTDSG